MVDDKGGGAAGAAGSIGSVGDELASAFGGLELAGFGEQFGETGNLNVSDCPATLDIEYELLHEHTQ